MRSQALTVVLCFVSSLALFALSLPRVLRGLEATEAVRDVLAERVAMGGSDAWSASGTRPKREGRNKRVMRLFYSCMLDSEQNTCAPITVFALLALL